MMGQTGMQARGWYRLLLIGLVVLGMGLAGCAMPAAAPVTETAGEAPESAAPAETEADEAQAEPAETVAEESEVPAEGTEPAEASQSMVEFVLDGQRSEARFIIEETLAGIHTIVTGTTSAVSGSVHTSPSQVADTRFEPITVDAATFVTDNGMRNRAIQNFILYTNIYPEIVFTPTALVGAPDMAVIGEEFAVEIVGSLQLLDTVGEVTFAATALFASETELQISGAATILWADFGVNVPMPPRVTWVADELTLEVDFGAVASPK